MGENFAHKIKKSRPDVQQGHEWRSNPIDYGFQGETDLLLLVAQIKNDTIYFLTQGISITQTRN